MHAGLVNLTDVTNVNIDLSLQVCATIFGFSDKLTSTEQTAY